MNELSVRTGDALPLNYTVPDGNTGLFPQAHVFFGGTEISGSPFDLAHSFGGRYENNSFTPISEGKYTVTYIVYSNAGHTIVSNKYGRVTEFFEVSPIIAQVDGLRTDYTTLRAGNLDNLDATITSRESEADASSRASANQTEHDATQAAITALNDPTVAQIADAVWDETLSDHLSSGSTGEALSSSGGLTLGDIANAVWDELVAGHNIANTFGSQFQTILQFVDSNNSELVDGDHGLLALKQEIIDQHVATVGQINANEVKIDDVRSNQDVMVSAIQANIDANEVKIEAIIPRINTAETNIKAEVDVNESKIDALDGKVSAIQNNTTVRFIVPEVIYKPESGDPTKNYQFHLRLFDTDGNPEAPDSTPTIRIRNLSSGVDIVSGASMTQDGAKVGAYFYIFSVSSGANLAHYLVEATVVENGVTRFIPATTEIVEFQTDLDAIQSAITTVDGKVTDNKSTLENPTFGLSAIRSKQNNIVSEIDANETKLNQIKAKTDLIPSDPATEGTLSTLSSQILSRPDIAAIQTRLNLQTDNLKGVDDRDLTDVYDNFDTSDLAKTADPRFAFLDAAISSRSSHSAGDIWSVATRTLTSISIPASEFEQVWDTLLTAITNPGSIGELIKTNLDAKVSGAATEAEVTSLLVGVAQEATLSGFISATSINFSEVDSATASIKADTAAIKPKTDNLPSDPASGPDVTTAKNEILSDIAGVQLDVDGIKAKTDLIPPDPAEESSVQAIPTNPVLATDPRINRLDADISSRSTLDNSDLAALAKSSELDTLETNIGAKVDTVEGKVDQVDLEVGQIKAKTDLLPSDPASNTRVAQAETNIIDEINDIPSGGGGGITPADVWTHPTRTLTQNPDDFKADVSGLATPADLIHEYENRMSTAFNNTTLNQEIIVWAQKDGQTVPGTDAKVTVRDADGAFKWSKTLASPNAQGIFKFVNHITVAADANFYVEIEITVDGEVRKSTQPFFTTG